MASNSKSNPSPGGEWYGASASHQTFPGAKLSPDVVRAFETARDGETCPLPPPPPSSTTRGGRNLLSVFEPPKAGELKPALFSEGSGAAAKKAIPEPLTGLQKTHVTMKKNRISNDAFDVLAGRPVGAFRGSAITLIGNFWNKVSGHNYVGTGLHRVASEEWR